MFACAVVSIENQKCNDENTKIATSFNHINIDDGEVQKDTLAIAAAGGEFSECVSLRAKIGSKD